MQELRFFPERAIEAILFLAGGLKAPDIHEVLKLRYFSDKGHLAKFGFLASGDQYKAMKYGPVAQGTYDLLKAARGDRGTWIPAAYPALTQSAFTVDSDDYVMVLRPANTDLLSRAEVECLTQALVEYGGKTFDERVFLSHDQAWKSAWRDAESMGAKCSEMPLESIAGQLPNAVDVIEYIRS